VIEERLAALRSALVESPYYAETLRAAGLSPHDLRSPDDLPHFPLLDRATLKSRASDLPAFHPDGPEAAEASLIQTSGSTGEPIAVLKDGYDQLHMWAVLRFWMGWLCIELPPRPRVLLACSLPGGIEYSVRLPLLEHGALHRIALQKETALRRWRKVAPDIVFTDPAGLHWMAAQERLPLPRLLLTSAQYLSPHERRRFGEALAAPIVNYYALTEVGPLAWECCDGPGRFHVLLPDVWVESVDGEIVVTRLRPSVLPLLRYRTGDHGDVCPDACPCGYRGVTITGFSGRRVCVFTRPDGQAVDAWQLAWLFKHYPLDRFRLTQRGPNDFLLELAASGIACDTEDLRVRLASALGNLGWPSPRLHLEVTAELASAGVKPKPFRRA
jgi:phenylacetate-CoA ligase